MKIIKNNHDFFSFQKERKEKLAFIPTMGALHDGHLSLVEEGLKQADAALVSIFVNPTQFAPHEDFGSYPRTIEADIEKLEAIGATAVWLPHEADIYPNGIETTARAAPFSKVLEGAFRPHFFDGVVTVVKRLFDLVQPDIALFGEKDFQQLQVIRAMGAEYKLPIDIIGVPTKRDENGLALSSRNVYLSAEEYQIAIKLNKIIHQMAQGDIDETAAHAKLLQVGFDKVDYITARNSETFGTENPDRILVAAYIGKTRLIDNMAMSS